jgi:hypothetical protein
MGHIEGEMPFLQRHLVGLETLSKKWRRKIRGQKAAKPSFSSHLFCSPLYERESWRDERLREGYARGHTHTHTERERRCVIARFVRETRDSERDTHADTHTHTESFLKERETVCYRAFCESYKRERD